MTVQITVYTKAACQPCRATKRFLTERGIDFDEQSLEDEGNLVAAKALGHMEAPVVVMGEKSWSGFRPDFLQEVVDKLGEQ